MSYLFDAALERIQGSFTSSYQLPITVACWVKLSDAAWGTTAHGFMQLGETINTDVDSLHILSPGVADRIQAKVKDATPENTVAIYDFTTDIYNDTWVMVYGIFTSSTARRVGIRNWTQSNFANIDITIGTTLDQILLGGYINSGGTNHLGGLGAEFCIWDKALVEADINALQTGDETGPAPNTIQSGNVIGYWPLSASNSTQSNEGSGAGGNLTVTGATYAEDHPTIASGTTINVPTGPWR